MAYKHSYLMNPSVTSCSEAAPPANMVVSNSMANSLDLMSLSPATQPSQPPLFVRIPLHAAVPLLNSNGPSSIHCFHEILANQGVVPQLHYDLQMPPPMNNLTNILARPGLQHPSIMPSTQQGWSLSSSSQLTTYINCPSEPRIPAPVTEISQASTEEVRFAGASEPASLASNGFSGLQSTLMSSKYLKVAQQLLAEVVGLGSEMKAESTKEIKSTIPQVRSSGDTRDSDDVDATIKQGAELTVAERQELQIKKSKLVDMLDEVEQRCRQYCHQLQNVVSAYEAAAGFGSSRTYTAPVLKTIPKRFQCLRDSISGQVQATSKILGEEDYLGLGIKSPSSRVRFIDHHRRQQRAIQQLGMVQHNTWRSQKGLPERAVSVLRAWLFEHFLHPYPNDSDKLMLAKQTGLTRSQVSNWFINARVRLWKPMVEKMYLEEIKEHDQNNMNDTTSKRVLTSHSTSKSPPFTVSTPAKKEDENDKSFVEDETIKQSRIKKARTEEPLHPNIRPHSVNMGLMSMGDGSQGANGKHGYSLITNCINNGGNYAPHSIVEYEKFDPEQFTSRFSGNRVSLTLGLQQCEALPLSEAQQPYLPSENIHLVRRLEH